MDLTTGKPAYSAFTEGRGALGCVALASDGKRAATACRDGSVLVWDVAQLLPRPTPKSALSASELRDSWSALTGADAKEAYKAAWALVEVSDQATEFMRSRLGPTPPVSRERLARSI